MQLPFAKTEKGSQDVKKLCHCLLDSLQCSNFQVHLISTFQTSFCCLSWRFVPRDISDAFEDDSA